MTDEDAATIAGILHGEWSKASDRLHAVGQQKNDGTPDWEEFHETRFYNAVTAEANARNLKDRFTEEFREQMMRGFGF